MNQLPNIREGSIEGSRELVRGAELGVDLLVIHNRCDQPKPALKPCCTA